MKTPILFLIFNRPDTTQEVFEAIKLARPEKLYIAADGARKSRENEVLICEEVRRIATAIDWPCQYKALFRENNLGCKLAVSSAIKWFFEQEECGIILEDDCHPAPEFFNFVARMLVDYKDDKSVYSVAGTSFLNDDSKGGHIRSEYSLMWGWGTWRDRWVDYDVSAKDYFSVILRKWCRRPIDLAYWIIVLRKVHIGEINTWDFQWILTLWRKNGRCIRPTINLVENIGFGEGATHTKTPSRFRHIKIYSGEPGRFDHPNLDDTIQRASEAKDRASWAMINYRTVLLLMFPILKRFRRS